MRIVAPQTGGPAYQKAAEAFRELYAAVTGVTLPISSTPGDTEDMIIIGTDAVQPYAFARVPGGFPVRSGSDDYCMISVQEAGRTLLILGGGRGRSTLYAVYDFFERRADCHYFWDGDVIPHRESIDITGLYVVEKPRFEYRAIRYFAHRGLLRFQAEHWDWEEWKRELDWTVKARLNTVMLRIGMDDLFQKAFPGIVDYPPTDAPLPGAGAGYNNRTTAWDLRCRGQLRKKILDYAFACDLMHPEDFGTMTHWYSRTPVDFLEKVQPTLMQQQSSTYSEQTGQVWNIFDDENVRNYEKLTDTHVAQYGKAEIFHTIGLAERSFFDEPEKNLELKKFAYKRFLSHIYERYPGAKIWIAAWDFYFRLTPSQVQELVQLFDPENTYILDYTADLKFPKSNMDKWDIMGKFPWIFGIFHGYMPQIHTHGDYDFLLRKVAQADADPCCKGMDFWPEMSHSDTLMLSFFTQNAWKPQNRSLPEIAETFCRNRYGADAPALWEAWRSYLPLMNLSNIDYTSCIFNLLKDGLIKRITDINHPDHEKFYADWSAVAAAQKPHGADIKKLLQTVRALPDGVLEKPFVRRDCVDLIRSALTQKLHIDYLETAIAFADWQRGTGSGEAVREKLLQNERLLDAFAELLSAHEDYSMYKTLCHQGQNRPINPYFEDALKDNILNDYCRTAAYELVKFVYTKEAAALGAWMTDCIRGGTYKAPDFTETLQTVFDAFKAVPLASMHAETQIPAAIDRILAAMTQEETL